jgi:outer membrane receptor protein involved in Fe transport
LRFRALATYIDKFSVNSGLAVTETAGDVGDNVLNGLPHWRGTFSATYQSDAIGLDARVRYVGGGKFNDLLNGTNGQPNLVNNDINERIYVDIGAQFRVADRFTFFGNVTNLFDRDPPIITTGSPHYDVVGRYFNFGARVQF